MLKARRSLLRRPAPGAGAPRAGFATTLLLTFLAMAASMAISALMIMVFVRFGAGSGLPEVGFRGALALAFLGSWFSLGNAPRKDADPSAFLDFMGNTLAHQLLGALLMLVLLGFFRLAFGWAR